MCSFPTTNYTEPASYFFLLGNTFVAMIGNYLTFGFHILTGSWMFTGVMGSVGFLSSFFIVPFSYSVGGFFLICVFFLVMCLLLIVVLFKYLLFFFFFCYFILTLVVVLIGD
jgi:hypothetical protein